MNSFSQVYSDDEKGNRPRHDRGFLFYSNLPMGEFARSAKGQRLGLAWAIADIFTLAGSPAEGGRKIVWS